MQNLTKASKSMIFFGVFMFSIASVFLSLEIPCAGIVLISVIFYHFRQIFSKTFAIVLMIVFLFGIVYTNYRIPQPDILSKYSYNKVSIQGIVTSIPTYKNNKLKFKLTAKNLALKEKTLTGNLGKTLVYLKSSKIPICIGDEVILEGNLRAPFQVENQSQFDYATYLQKQGIFSIFYTETVHVLNQNSSKNLAIKKIFNNLSNKILNKHLTKMSDKNANLLGGIVFGNRSVQVDYEVQENFRNSGIYHVLSASGLHVGVVLLFWNYFMKLLSIPFSISLGSSAVILLIFGGFTGFPPAVCRAILMAEFVILGKLIDRKANSIALLMLVAFLMLLYNPIYIIDVGFQLSFITTFGILFCFPFMLKNFNFKPEFLSNSIFLTLIAQLFSSPLLIYYFHALPVYSLFANLLIVPLVSIITFVGFFINMIAILPKTGFIITIFDYFLIPILNLSNFLAKFFASLPYSVFFVKQIEINTVILMYIFLIFGILSIKTQLKNRLFNIISLMAFLGILIFNISLPTKTLDITVFSLGNSDAILVEFPNHKKILIDTGKSIPGSSSSGKIIINNYLKSHGIMNLDCIILTHPDSDHIGGCIDILDEIIVKKIYQPKITSDSSIYCALQDKIKKENITLQTLSPNTSTTIDLDGTIFKIIAPSGLDTNANSLITYIKLDDFSSLFMGDAEKESLYILKRNNIKNIKVLKVGHHGSQKSLDEKMLVQLQPQRAIICSQKNDENHPHPDTTRLLSKQKTEIYDTANDNMLKFSYNTKTKDLSIKKFDSKTKKFIKEK